MSVICLAGLPSLDWLLPSDVKTHPNALLSLQLFRRYTVYFKELIILAAPRHLIIYKEAMEWSADWLSYTL